MQRAGARRSLQPAARITPPTMADERDRDSIPPRGYTTQDVEAERAVKPRRRHTGKKILAGIVLTPLLILVPWLAVALNWSYSSGERGGFVQKFSRKGFLCKTWEGELAMVNLPGSIPQIFQFTVRNDSLARIIERAVTSGERVALHYEQHVGVPTSCFGETEYWVTEVRTSTPPPTAPAAPPATTTPPPATTPPATTPPRP